MGLEPTASRGQFSSFSKLLHSVLVYGRSMLSGMLATTNLLLYNTMWADTVEIV